MKTLILITVYFCSSFSWGQLTDRLVTEYCALDNPAAYRYCLMENGQGRTFELFRNCVRQVKLLHTLDEMTDFLCSPIGNQEINKVKDCYDPVVDAEIKYDKNFLPIVETEYVSFDIYHEEHYRFLYNNIMRDTIRDGYLQVSHYKRQFNYGIKSYVVIDDRQCLSIGKS